MPAEEGGGQEAGGERGGGGEEVAFEGDSVYSVLAPTHTQ